MKRFAAVRMSIGSALALIICGMVTLGAQAPAAQPPAGGSQPAGDAVRGKAVFLAHQCWACHGYTVETGTRLLQENGNFVARLGTVNTFTNYLRAPRPDQAPPLRSLTSMPSYGAASLPNDQAADLYAYIRSIKPTQPALKDIPLLVQMSNEGGKPKK